MSMPDDARQSRGRLTGSRLEIPDVVFALCLIAAAVFVLVVSRNDQWFRADFWEMISTRTITPSGLLTPFHGHCIAIPIVFFNVLLRTVGLGPYLPYQVLVLAGHLAVCVLLREVMLRQGIRRWTATLVMVPLIVFGAGRENIVVAFQFALVASLAFGLGQFVLADQPGKKLNRRDFVGVACGLLGLLCAGTALVTIGATGLMVLSKRGRRVAAFHVVPLGVVYGGWMLLAPASDTPSRFTGSAVEKMRRLVEWYIDGFRLAFRGLGWNHFGLTNVVAIALGVLLVVGVVAAVRRTGWSRQMGLVSAGALALAAVALITLTCLRRGDDLSAGAATRYVYLTAALILPLLGLAIDALITRSRVFVGVAAVLLAVGIPANINGLRPTYGEWVFVAGTQRDFIIGVAHSPLAAQSERSATVTYPYVRPLSARWLSATARAGRFPREVTPQWVTDLTRSQLAIQQVGKQGPTAQCRTGDASGVTLKSERGAVIGVSTGPEGTATNSQVVMTVTQPPEVSVHPQELAFKLNRGTEFRMLVSGVTITITGGSAPVTVCTS